MANGDEIFPSLPLPIPRGRRTRIEPAVQPGDIIDRIRNRTRVDGQIAIPPAPSAPVEPPDFPDEPGPFEPFPGAPDLDEPGIDVPQGGIPSWLPPGSPIFVGSKRRKARDYALRGKSLAEFCRDEGYGSLHCSLFRYIFENLQNPEQPWRASPRTQLVDTGAARGVVQMGPVLREILKRVLPKIVPRRTPRPRRRTPEPSWPWRPPRRNEPRPVIRPLPRRPNLPDNVPDWTSPFPTPPNVPRVPLPRPSVPQPTRIPSPQPTSPQFPPPSFPAPDIVVPRPSLPSPVPVPPPRPAAPQRRPRPSPATQPATWPFSFPFRWSSPWTQPSTPLRFAPSPSPLPAPSVPAPTPAPSVPLTPLNPAGLPFGNLATAQANCPQPKQRKKRKCHQRAPIRWAGGPKKGELAGSRCYAFKG